MRLLNSTTSAISTAARFTCRSVAATVGSLVSWMPWPRRQKDNPQGRILPEFSARVSRSRRYFLILRPYIAICFMKEENSKVTRQGPLRGGTTTCRPKFEHEFRLRPARLGDYFFALSLYLEGAQMHLSKIGQWNRPRIVSKFRQGYKRAPAQIICVGDKTNRLDSGGRLRRPHAPAAASSRRGKCADRESARSSSRSCFSARMRSGST